jgi:phospholipase/carboxylesterase
MTEPNAAEAPAGAAAPTQPGSAKPAPTQEAHSDMSVLLFLHGHDDDAGTWAAAAAAMAPDGWTVIRPTGPRATATGRRSWFGADDDGVPRADEVRAALADVAGHLRAAAADHRVGPERVVLAGFSQGAALALLYVLADDAGLPADRPRPGAAVAVAGWLPDVDGLAATGATLATDRLLMAHGRDDEVVPFPLGRSVARLLERQGHTVAFVAGEGGHDPAPLASAVRAWLADHTA